MRSLHTFLNFLQSNRGLILFLLTFKLFLHLVAIDEYGFHRDEFLYIAMGDHLAWGYLEVPPFIAFIAKFSKVLLGTSLFAYRFIPVLTGCLNMFLTVLVTRELGGNRYAQLLAGLLYILAPAFLATNYLLQPVVFDQFFWILAVYLLIRLINSRNRKYWLRLGVVLGLGLLNKYTVLLLGFSIFISMILTEQRQYLKTKWPWISAGVALLIFVPNLYWQFIQGWPIFEHLQTLQQTQFVNVSPVHFLIMQILMSLWGFPVALLGLYFIFIQKRFRIFGWIFLICFLTLLLFSAKAYYLLPAYPMLFAAGACFIERSLHMEKRKLWQTLILLWIIINHTPVIPYALPVLSIEQFEKYARFMKENMGMTEPLRWEDGKVHQIRQDYADMLGWENQVATIARVFHGLSEKEKQNCQIIASNYGQAGAIDYYHQKYKIPPAVSFVGSYYLWGPGKESHEIYIIVGIDQENLKDIFGEIRRAAIISHPMARENNIPVQLCRYLRIPVRDLWAMLKKYRY